MVGVKVIANDADFQPELAAAGSRLAVVKFTMAGCRPCIRIAPAFNLLSNKYPQVVFLEVDVHVCQATAAANNISATPTFLFLRNRVRVDQYQGADSMGLEEKVKQHTENDPGNNEDSDIPKGYGDEAVVLEVILSQVQSLGGLTALGVIEAHGARKAPKLLKVFINLPRSMSFDDAERSEPTQALDLGEDDLKDDGLVPLRYVKFQNVQSVTLFVKSNQGDEETTKINYLTFIGTPVQATNMNDFKRVVGKKGESH
ncbi:hypothetical protein CRUP_024299 [Coryphaenoides rupestris]|nr:hypothetical protein CRUP_024299 [Coryphaenoides rupestris]